MKTHLVWLRNDLRTLDNPALYAACQDPQARVIALFIPTVGQWQLHGMAGRQAAFIRDGLRLLSEELDHLGIPLLIREAERFSDSIEVLQQVVEQYQVNALFYNYQYELNEHQRDRQVEQKLNDQDIACQGFHDGTLVPPGSVLTGKGTMYHVYTPFSKALAAKLRQELPECYPAPQGRTAPKEISADKVPDFTPLAEHYDQQLFPPGAREALRRLRDFSLHNAADYDKQRDIPATKGTSELSPYLATGQLSARQCLHRILRDNPDALSGGKGAVWLNEIFWREFYRHLLVAHPRLCRHQPYTDWTRHIEWRTDKKQLSAWQQGKTGYPIVDAAMKQLNTTGWMHNRLRMIVASFLVKDLLIDWREGERYFMSQLLDGDLAANNGGWQWAASTGTDAAPYFRIFNPQLQGERFDPEGEFIRRWIPELDKVPGKAIHDPWTWAKKHQVTLDYPQPVVEHKKVRQTTLQAYEAARKQGQNSEE